MPKALLSLRVAQRLSAALLCLVALGCYATNNYSLKLDATEQSKSQLCERSSHTTDEACEPLAGQTLEAPGVLTVQVSKAQSDRRYHLRLDQMLRGATEVPTPDDVIKQVSTRLTGLSKDFVGPLDPGEPAAPTEAAKKLLLSVSTSLAPKKPAAAAALAGVAAGLEAPKPPGIRAEPESGTMQPWIDGARAEWKDGAGFNLFQRPPPPRAFEYNAFDLQYVKKVADEIRQKNAALTDRLSGDHFSNFTVRWCKPDSFGIDPFTGKPWLGEEPPWADPGDLLRKLALDPEAMRKLVATDSPDLRARLLALRKEALAAEAAKVKPSEPAIVLHYLFNVTLIARQLETCEHNLAMLATASAPPAVASTLLQVQRERKTLESTVTAESVFEKVVSPLAVRAAVQELSSSSGADAVAFGAYTLHPGRITLAVTANGASDASGAIETSEPVAQLEFTVRDVGPVSVSVGPIVSVCSKCIHSVQQRFNVVADATMGGDAGAPMVQRVLDDDTSSVSIGYAAMLHYSLWGGTRNQLGLALGYPLHDQTGTALGVLAGASYRNTVGIQLTTGVHVFETRAPRDGSVPVDVSSGEAAALTPDDVTQAKVTAAWFLFFGATSDLLMKP